MAHDLLSLRSRNSFGNVAMGLCLVGLGLARILDPGCPLALGAAICLLVTSVVALLACLSPRREMPDEMSEAHDGQAAGHALRITLIAVGATCAVSMIMDLRLDFTSASLGLIGFGLLVYGSIFGWLER